MKLVKTLLLSALMTCISIVIAVVVGMFVPVAVGGHIPSSSFSPAEHRYSAAELDAAEQLMKEKVESIRRRDRELPGIKLFAEMRQPFELITWIPWVFLAFLQRAKDYRTYAVALVPPVAAVLVGVISVLELLLFVIASVVGILLYASMKRRT